MQLRRLALDDMAEAARVHRASFDECLPWLAGLHTLAEDRDFFERHVFVECLVWGVFQDEALLGFVAFREGWIDQLYVLPGNQRRGIGTALLEIARSGAASLSLWTFQRNDGARRFYERHGSVTVQETDGAGNEEREPDVLYRWVAAG